MRDYPGRRYPPTPYPPRSEATALYRDGWDQGWEDLGRRGAVHAAERYEGMADGPYRHGYRDGGDARLKRELRISEADREWRARWRQEAREELLRRAGEEGPY